MTSRGSWKPKFSRILWDVRMSMITGWKETSRQLPGSQVRADGFRSPDSRNLSITLINKSPLGDRELH